MSGLWIPREFQKPPIGARVNWAHPSAHGLIGCWPCSDAAGIRWHNVVNAQQPIVERSNSSVVTWQGSAVGLAVSNDGYNKDAPFSTGTENLTPPLNVTAIGIVKQRDGLNTYEGRTTLNESLAGGFTRTGRTENPPTVVDGNASWLLQGPYEFFGALRYDVGVRYSDDTTADRDVTLAGVSPSQRPLWHVIGWSYRDQTQSVLSVCTPSSGVVHTTVTTETKSLKSVAQPFTPMSWRNFSDFSWSGSSRSLTAGWWLWDRAMRQNELEALLRDPWALLTR
jgi:hypothetical protein